MASVLSSPTPSLPSGSVPIVTPPLLDSPGEIPSGSNDRDQLPPPLDPASSSPSSASATTESQPSTPTSSTSGGHSAHSSVVPAYPYNVAMAPSSFGGGPVPDDSEITTRLPSICVDYLSHDWAEDDVWTSWKAMTRHKSEIANGVRLENASWRTWAKQRGKLKTISPETLNWLKDSDVTWLYGPLHTAVEAVPPPKVASANDRLGLEPLRPLNKEPGGTPKKAATLPAPTPEKLKNVIVKKENPATVRLRRKSEPKTKPILKYRSLSDILMPQGQPTSPNLEQLGMDLEDQATISVHHARSDSHLVRLNSLNRKTRASPAHSPAGSSPERGASDSSSSASYFFQQAAAKKKERRHISFNHRVEQCIAIDSTDEVARSRHYGSTASSSSSSDDDDVLTFGSSPRHPQLPLKGEQEPHTIARLGPTTLKSIEIYPAPSPAVVYQTSPDDEDEDEILPPVAHESTEAPTPVSTQESRSGGGGAGSTSGAALLAGAVADSAPQGGVTEQTAGQRAMFNYSGGGSRPQWDPEDEDDYAMGFDYFTGGGPDIGIGDEYDMASYGPAHLVGGTHNGYQGGSVAQSSSYLGHGPYSPTSPYAPGNGGSLDPSVDNANAPTIPHYRDNDASRGPYSPPSTREAPSPKRSAMKGARNREPSTDSDMASYSPSSPSLASATSPTLAVATAIPSHVRPSSVRRTSSEERAPTTERGRSASRGSSSSLERAASADRRTSTSISPSSSYSPPSNATGPSTSLSAKPISIQPSQRIGSYESLGSVGSAMGPAAGGASTGRMPDVPEVSPQSEAPYGVEVQAGGSGGGRPLHIMTSSSVDSFNSFGMPTTPTSPVNMMSSPQTQRFQSFNPNTDDDEDDNARVEDVNASPSAVDQAADTGKPAIKAAEPPVSAPVFPPTIPSLPNSHPSSSLEVHAPMPTHSGSNVHSGNGLSQGRLPSGPRLRNPSPSNPTTSTTNEEGHGHPTSSTERLVKSPSTTSLDRISSRADSNPTATNFVDSAQPSTSAIQTSTSSDRKPSFARRSLLRAARASSEQGREQSPPALARSASEGATSSSSSTPRASTPNVDGEYSFGYDEDAGKGIDVAGTARDLLGAISKGIWGSLGGGRNSSSNGASTRPSS